VINITTQGIEPQHASIPAKPQDPTELIGAAAATVAGDAAASNEQVRQAATDAASEIIQKQDLPQSVATNLQARAAEVAQEAISIRNSGGRDVSDRLNELGRVTGRTPAREVNPDNAVQAEPFKGAVHTGYLRPDQEGYDDLFAQTKQEVQNSTSAILTDLREAVDPDVQELVRQAQDAGSEENLPQGWWGRLDQILGERYFQNKSGDNLGIGQGEVTATNLIRNIVGQDLRSGDDGRLPSDTTEIRTGGEPYTVAQYLRNESNAPSGDEQAPTPPNRRTAPQGQYPTRANMERAQEAVEQAELPQSMAVALSTMGDNSATPSKQRAANENVERNLRNNTRDLPEEARTVWKAEDPESFADQQLAEFMTMQQQNPELYQMMFPEEAQAQADINRTQAQARNERARARINETKDQQLTRQMELRMKAEKIIGAENMEDYAVQKLKSELDLNDAEAKRMAAQATLWTAEANQIKEMMENPQQGDNAATLKMLRELGSQALTNPENMSTENLRSAAMYLNFVSRMENAGMEFSVEPGKFRLFQSNIPDRIEMTPRAGSELDIGELTLQDLQRQFNGQISDPAVARIYSTIERNAGRR